MAIVATRLRPRMGRGVTRSLVIAGVAFAAPVAHPVVRAQGVAVEPASYDRDAGVLTMTTPAVDLPAAGAHMMMHEEHAGHMGMPDVLRTIIIPADGWVRGYTIDLTDAAGRPVPHAVVHHVNLIMPGRRELFSPIMLRVGAAGAETAPVRLPRVLGLEVHRGDTLLVKAMLHNPTPRGYRGVQVHVRMPFTPKGTWFPPMSVYPFYLDVMPPAGKHAYDLPPGHSQQSWEGRPALAGRILGVGGHLHKYATVLRLEDITAKRVLWEAAPSVDAGGDVVAIPTTVFYRRLGIAVRPDHVYRLTAVYDNPTGSAIPDGAMGALGGVFLPERGARWPAADRRNPEYRLDVSVTYPSAAETDSSAAMGPTADSAAAAGHMVHHH